MEPQHSIHYDLGTHSTKDTIRLITSLLEKIIGVNDVILSSSNNSTGPPNTQQKLSNLNTGSRHGCSTTQRMSTHNIYTCFHARTIPSISIQAYLSRILKYCPCTNECFLAILVYFDRMAKVDHPTRTVPLRIDSYNVHRFIIAGIMIASKLFSDVFFTNARYAKVGGLPVSELNALEVEFLALNGYKLFVTIEEFQYYGDQLLLRRIKEHEDRMGMAIRGSGYIDNKKHIPSITTSAMPSHHAFTKSHDTNMIQTETPSPVRNQKVYEYNALPINQTARQLPIDEPSVCPSVLAHSLSTPNLKYPSRKSDEIDRHRLFKRPSYKAINTMRDPISTKRQFDLSTTSDQSTLPIPLSASPSSDQGN